MKLKIIDEVVCWAGEGVDGRTLASRLTLKMDNLLIDVFNSVAREKSMALLATGGYGRGELAPYSDIDIMFFAEDRHDSSEAEEILYKLWDLGLDISHSFRTAEECVEDAYKDIRTRTSLLEARYVAGDRDLFTKFRKEVYPRIAFAGQKAFVREKLKEMENRHRASGHSVYLLEPHVKEGEGGLRDIHTVYWLSKVAFRLDRMSDVSSLMSPYDYKRYMSAYDFMLKTRFCLHLGSGRRNDVLTFEMQKSIASCLGFRDSKKFSASERLMRYYYLKSRIIKDLTLKVMVLCSKQYMPVLKDLSIRKLTAEFFVSRGRIISSDENLLTSNTDKIMELFYHYSRTGKKFSEGVYEKLRGALLRINKRTRSSPASVHYFLEILKGRRIYETLREMHETGVLGRFIPEFGALRLLVVHEPYHMYTVDEHTLLAIKHLEELRTTKFKNLEDLNDIIGSFEGLDILFLALLFHDIGKAAGRHHEEAGYKRLKNIMERFNIDVEKRLRIEFLVRNHIVMSNIALRREAGDTEVIAGFADVVGDPENLRALYLITYADMSAVNPGFWSSWKAYLLRELYEHTLDYFSGVRGEKPVFVTSLGALAPGIDMSSLNAFISDMPDRYLVSATRNRILEDFRLQQEVKEKGFSIRIDTSTHGFTEISVGALDCPGLFSKIVGFFSAKGLNIVNGRIFTGKNGVVIDKISVSNWKDVYWSGFEKEIERGLKGVVVDGNSVPVVRRTMGSDNRFDLFIELDNEASDEFSIVEIFSQDRLGLLYDITTIMFRTGVNIVSARIDTDKGLARDIFYLQADSYKIDYTKAEGLLSELWSVLTE